MICKNEGINIDSDNVLDTLIQVSEGDLRRSINTLQTCSSFIKGSDKSLSVNDIEKISGIVPKDVIEDIYNKIKQSKGYSDIQDLAQNLILDGYDVQQLITRVLVYYIEQDKKRVPDVHKARIAEIIAESDFKMIQGGDEELNLLHTLSSISMVCNS